MPIECSNPYCGVGPRCPVCTKTIVDQAQAICTSCQPWACENCGKEAKFAYNKKKTPAEVTKEANLLMGYAGSGVNKCTDCKKIKATGDMGICFDCAKKRVVKTELVCHVCLHRNTPFKFNDANREGTCFECGQVKVVNDESLCQSCFKKLRVKDTHKCWGCQEDFIPLKSTDNFCQECIELHDYRD